jgi:DNA-binding response OmpR family regulator
MAHETTGSLLLIEDEPAQRNALAVLLRHRGYAVAVAETGHDALRFLAEQRPDLILLDMFLPELDGWAFLQKKQGELQDATPVLIMTGLNVATREWAHSLGAEDIVRKPIHFDQLLEKIDTYCEVAAVS